MNTTNQITETEIRDYFRKIAIECGLHGVGIQYAFMSGMACEVISRFLNDPIATRNGLIQAMQSQKTPTISESASSAKSADEKTTIPARH